MTMSKNEKSQCKNCSGLNKTCDAKKCDCNKKNCSGK